MEIPTPQAGDSIPMNELSNEEQQRLENWKDLQLALGISPDDAPPANPSNAAPARPAAPVIPPPRPERPKLPPAAEEIHLFGEGLVLEEPAVESQSEAESAQEVEVGEAPEEIPDEPASAEEKRHRRRRRRRRRGGSDDNGENEPAEAVQPGGEAIGGPAAPADVEDAEDDDGTDDELADDDEEEVESISFADWTVPSWNELIGSLYRPER
jgi:hypothetical protein